MRVLRVSGERARLVWDRPRDTLARIRPIVVRGPSQRIPCDNSNQVPHRILGPSGWIGGTRKGARLGGRSRARNTGHWRGSGPRGGRCLTPREALFRLGPCGGMFPSAQAGRSGHETSPPIPSPLRKAYLPSCFRKVFPPPRLAGGGFGAADALGWDHVGCQ